MRPILPEWRDEQGDTGWPFVASANLTTDDGRVLLFGTVADALLYVSGAAAGLYLSRVSVAAGTVTVAVGDPARAELASGSFPGASPPEILALTTLGGRPAGTLVLTTALVAGLAGWGDGDHRFSRAASEFCPAAVVPCPEAGLTSIAAEGDAIVLSGDVWLVGGAGVVLRPEDGAATQDACGVVAPRQGIRVDVVGDPLFRRRLCAGSDVYAAPRPIRSFRFLGPGGVDFTVSGDAWGEVQIVGSDVNVADPALRIGASAGGLVVELAGG